MLKSKPFRVTVSVCLALGLLAVAFVFGVNALVVSSAKENVITAKEAAELEDVDCIIVLGCLVRSDGTLSDMLCDRVERGIEVYELMAEKSGSKLLMSGDHGTVEYDEVNAMKQYAIGKGIESEEIFMDHAGFSTYESIYRAKEIFGAERVVIITQEYHLYRALYIADALGLEAYGVASDQRTYSGQTMRDVREILARNKDFLTSLFKPKPTYLGETISLDGSGDVTNDY
ncbi:MAG: YdcF family protein [Clostridia bacterium]|nr:YdcF family protein [Clostridia bacterium]